MTGSRDERAREQRDSRMRANLRTQAVNRCIVQSMPDAKRVALMALFAAVAESPETGPTPEQIAAAGERIAPQRPLDLGD